MIDRNGQIMPTVWSMIMTHETIVNPYEPPLDVHRRLDFGRRGSTLIPRQLAERTRRVVNRFGHYQFLWPIGVVYWTDALVIDVIALFIATNGLRIQCSSFKGFPWTALLCGLYPIVFVVSIQSYDPYQLANWIPSRGSPVLALQLVSTFWAVYAVVMIVRCHLSHRRPEAER